MNFSFAVTSLGFKPGTFWSVVRCSIQLSYEAISLIAFAKVMLFIGKAEKQAVIISLVNFLLSIISATISLRMAQEQISNTLKSSYIYLK